jgi:hypothetical protein
VEQEHAFGGEWSMSTPSTPSHVCDWPDQYEPKTVLLRGRHRLPKFPGYGDRRSRVIGEYWRGGRSP